MNLLGIFLTFQETCWKLCSMGISIKKSVAILPIPSPQIVQLHQNNRICLFHLVRLISQIRNNLPNKRNSKCWNRRNIVEARHKTNSVVPIMTQINVNCFNNSRNNIAPTAHAPRNHRSVNHSVNSSYAPPPQCSTKTHSTNLRGERQGSVIPRPTIDQSGLLIKFLSAC